MFNYWSKITTKESKQQWHLENSIHQKDKFASRKIWLSVFPSNELCFLNKNFMFTCFILFKVEWHQFVYDNLENFGKSTHQFLFLDQKWQFVPRQEGLVIDSQVQYQENVTNF
jgi:hypothetical protein